MAKVGATRKPNKYRKIEIIECVCGCGEMLNKYDERNRMRSRIKNHWDGIRHDGQFKKGRIPHNKKDGKTISKFGYILLNIGKKKFYEHRVVMEKHLGRRLEPSEHIHHIDGDRQNNSINNLMIVSNSDHLKLHYKRGDLKLRGVYYG